MASPTHNGEARAIESFEKTKEILALLSILALGNQQVTEGRVKPVADIVKRLRERAATE